MTLHLRLQQRQATERWGRRQSLQERVHVGNVLIRHHLRFVRRHLALGRSQISQKSLERNRPRPQPRPLCTPLPSFAMALIAADPFVERFAFGGASGRRGCCRCRRDLGLCFGRGRPRRRDRRQQDPNRRRAQWSRRDHRLQRARVTTSTSAGSPRFTTARARAIAGPNSFGFVMGPSACTPSPCASLEKSILGSESMLPI
jgi:hypothetical protein